MTKEFPSSEEEARQHIEVIRRQKGLGVDGDITKDLENALVIIAEELYQNPAHFLLELIQNADDNVYNHGVTPTLTVSFGHRILQLSCNERGFSRKNVEALCKIGSSTKAGAEKAAGYIGEKGIGFKSVFKVAGVVWINSGQYSFKFDKKASLGMLAPIWADFPGPHAPGWTSIRLELLPEYADEDLVRDLRALDSRSLLFLRRLRKIDVSVTAKDLGHWSTTMSRNVETPQDTAKNLITLQQDESVQSYVVLRHFVDNLPSEPKRSGICKSPITLAFPHSKYEESGPPSQSVYSFLPIRDFGFKFLLNVDFVLNASREAIAETRWNKTLRDSLPGLFASAVDLLRDTELRFCWLSFLPAKTAVDDFFKDVRVLFVSQVSALPVLESIGGDLSIPGDLTYVPPKFRDDDGRPMTELGDMEDTFKKYLSSGYDCVELAILKDLGVCEMTDAVFLDLLAIGVTKHREEYFEQPAEWHSRLAAQLLPIVSAGGEVVRRASTFPLIPLRDGRWVAPHEKIAVFTSSTKNFEIPSGIEVAEVHPDAAGDPDRRRLLTMLGVSEMSPETVCDLLATAHEGTELGNEIMAGEKVMSHIKFMYQSGWTNPRKRDLWFLADSGGIRRGSELYLDTDNPHATRRYLHRSIFLHPKYMDIEPQPDLRPSFLTWLTDCHKLCAVPRLVYPAEGAPFRMSMEFSHILRSHNSSQILLLFRDNWSYYSRWIAPNPAHDPQVNKAEWESSREELLRKLSNMHCGCLNGHYARLRDTSLPRRGFFKTSKSRMLDFLDIYDPESEGWDFLLVFGVRVQTSIDSLDSRVGRYVERLEGLKEHRSPPFEDISDLYRKIHVNGDSELTQIRAVFNSRKLIFVPYTGTTEGAWYSAAECKWDGNKALRKTPILKKYYSHLASYFCEMLAIPLADGRTVVDEMLRFRLNDNISYIVKLFGAIKHLFPDLKDLDLLGYSQILRDSYVFPILRNEGHLGSTFDSLDCGLPSSSWYIADRPYLRKSFEGVVPLLSFTDVDFTALHPTLEAIGVMDRRLTTRASSKLHADDKIEFLDGFTSLVRQKVQYIARVIPKETTDRTKILNRILGSVVYLANQLEIHWFLKTTDGEIIKGRPETGRGFLRESPTGLEIFVTKSDSSRMTLPIDAIEDLVKICGVSDTEGICRLNYVLMENDLERIEAFLDRRGVMADPAEDWASSEALLDDPRGKALAPSYQREVSRKNRRAMNDALDELERDKAFRVMVSKPWNAQSVDRVKPLLARLCRLAKQDSSLFVPLNHLDHVIGAGGDNHGVCETQFNTSFNELRNSYSKTSMILPATLEIARTQKRRFSVFGPPGNTLDDEAMFFGELYVSRILGVHLGTAYSPEVNWTSSLRTRAGLKPTQTMGYVPAFTVDDKSRALYKLLDKKGVGISVDDKSRLVFHIDVITIEGRLEGANFFMHPAQFEHIRKYSLRNAESSKRASVTIPILIAVCGIQTQPKAVLLVDPYAMYLDGTLQLTSPAHLRGEFTAETPENLVLEDTLTTDDGSGSTRKKWIKRLLKPSADKEYQYQPLASHRTIRLLELERDAWDAPLKGKIRVEVLSAATEFVALSYTWGVAIKPYKLTTPEGVIWITVSCDSALRSVRRRPKPTLVWVDAVCIDQDNAHEKTIQIRLMRDIFRSAKHVYGWVGDDADNSELAMQTLQQIRALRLDSDAWPADLPVAPPEWGDTGLPPEGDEAWFAIDQLFDRPWFKRAWIIQEVVLAQSISIVCGATEIPWKVLFEGLKVALAKTIRLMEASRIQPGSVLQKTEAASILGRTRRLYLRREGKLRLDLLSLLDRFSYTKATIEVDRLFALVGLASDAGDEIFNPDYASSLEEVVRRYAGEFVRRDKVLELLYRAGSAKSYPFASWIPCWTGDDVRPRSISSWRGGKGQFRACGDTGLVAQLCDFDPKMLVVTATMVDTVVEVGDKTIANSNMWSFHSELFVLLRGLKTYPTGESIASVQVRLPIGDARRPVLERAEDIGLVSVDDAQPGDSGPRDEVDWPPEAVNIPSLQALLDFLRVGGKNRAAMFRYWQTVSAFSLRLGHGRFITTSRGYAGLAPSATKPGDMVVIVHGAAVPFIIRGDSEDTESRLVGECYVHGLMNGEALKLNDVRQQSVLLR